MSYLLEQIKEIENKSNEGSLFKFAHLNIDNSKFTTFTDKDQFFEANPTEERRLTASICSDDVAYESSYSDEIDKRILKSLKSGTNSEESINLVKSFHSLIEEGDVNLKDSESSSTFRLKIDTNSISNSSESSNNYLGNLIESFNDTEELSKSLIENVDNETISKSSETGSTDDRVVGTCEDNKCAQLNEDNKLVEVTSFSELPYDKTIYSTVKNEESYVFSNVDKTENEVLVDNYLEPLSSPSVAECDLTNNDSSVDKLEDLSEKEENSEQWEMLLERLAQLQEDLPKLRKELADAKQRNMELALENWRLATRKGQALWTVDAERARKVTAIAECQNMLAEVDALCSAELDNIQDALRTLEPLHRANSAHFWPPPLDYTYGQLSAALMRRDVLMEVTTSLNVSSADEALEHFSIP